MKYVGLEGSVMCTMLRFVSYTGVTQDNVAPLYYGFPPHPYNMEIVYSFIVINVSNLKYMYGQNICFIWNREG